MLFAIIVGITIVTNEFRHGTVTPTFLAEPHRERVIVAKAIARSSSVAIGFALLSLVVVAAVAIPWLSIVDAQLQLGDARVPGAHRRADLSRPFSGRCWASRSARPCTARSPRWSERSIWIFVVENLLIGLLGLVDADGVAEYLPFHALDAADGTGGDNLLSYGPGVAVSLGWILLLGAFGIWRTLRRDIS